MKLRLFRRRALCLFCSVLFLCALTANGSAAEGTLNVEINGVKVDFTDAFPENHNNRNFLPFAAIFEALGAELHYDHSTYTGTATRGDTVVEVLIGTNILTVSRDGGEKEIIEMDVASYTKNNRTYVPLGYMAQALGFRAEWDQQHETVVLIDTETIAKEAVSKYNYTLLERSGALLNRYSRGNWSVEGRMDYEVSYGETALVRATAEYEGLVAEDGKSQIFLDLDADYSVWYRAQTAAGGMTLEQLGVGVDELYPTMACEMRGDAAAGTNYFRVIRANGLPDTLPQNIWLTGNSVPTMEGMKLTALPSVGDTLDAVGIIRAAMAKLDLRDCTTAMEVAGTCAEELARTLSDEAAVETEDGLLLAWWACGVDNQLLAFRDDHGNVSAVIWEQRGEVGGVRTVTQTAADDQGTVILTAMAESGGQTVYMAQGGIYTATERTPMSALPEGVNAVPYER